MQINDGRVISNFIVQALQGRPITVFGNGTQTRSFCYVDDLIDGLIALMESDDHVTGPINLGNPTELSILGIAEKILGLTNSQSEIVFKPLPADDPRQRQPDIRLARDLLNWKHKIGLEDGLERTIEYFDKVLSATS